MKAVTTINAPEFTVISYGNGTAISFINKTLKRYVFAQGDDVDELRAALDERHSLSDVWGDYEDVSNPMAEGKGTDDEQS
jgi:hypothetical protein